MANDAFLGSPDNPRTAAVVSYITVIGWVIAYLMLYKASRNSFSAFHLRQTLMLHILALILNVLSMMSLWHVIPFSTVVVLAILLFVLWLMGAFSAINGKTTPVPLVGNLAQKMFRNL